MSSKFHHILHNLLGCVFFFAGSDKVARYWYRKLWQSDHKEFEIRSEFFLCRFITLGKNQRIGSLTLMKSFDKRNIDRLWSMPTIDEDEDHSQILLFLKIIIDHHFSVLALFFLYSRISISWKINQIDRSHFSRFICYLDIEVIDQLRLTRFHTRFGKLSLTTETIDQRRFTDITPADEGIFWSVRARTLRIICSTTDKWRFDNSIGHRHYKVQ